MCYTTGMMTLTEFLYTEAKMFPGSKIEIVYDRNEDGEVIWVYGQTASVRFELDDAFSNGGQYNSTEIIRLEG